MEHRKTAFISGATSGIGRAFAESYAGMGYDLIITGRRDAMILAAAERIKEKHKVNVRVEIADFSDHAALERLAGLIAGHGSLQVLVNNAGTCTNKPYTDSDWCEHEAVLDCNARAIMRFTYAALPGMLDRGCGDIINVSSLGAYIPFPTNAMYSATKAFVNYFTESLYLELKGTGLRLQALCPGMTRTDFHTRFGVDAADVYKSKGTGKAMLPEEVVAESLAGLERKRLFCIPGAHNRRTVFMARHAKRSAVHNIVLKMLKGMNYDTEKGLAD